MSTLGIIAEYNPFHSGHKYLIDRAKEITGADTVIVVMSGDFVQRGAPAICDKYARTKMALQSGVDIVFELPVVYSTGSAERFAEGAVRLLSSLGVVDYIAFGSECGEIEPLMELATILVEEPEEYRKALDVALREGMPYPKAREKAIGSYFAQKDRISEEDENDSVQKNSKSEKDVQDNFTQQDSVIKHGSENSNNSTNLSKIISSPNNILGIEYCKAILRIRREISVPEQMRVPELVTVRREGSGYSDEKMPELLQLKKEQFDLVAAEQSEKEQRDLVAEGQIEKTRYNFASATALRRELLSEGMHLDIVPTEQIPTGKAQTEQMFSEKMQVDNKHPENVFPEMISESEIMEQKHNNVRSAVPCEVFDIINSELGRTMPICEDDFSDMLFASLLRIETTEELAGYQDITPDLANRIFKLRGLTMTFTEMAQSVKAKNLTYTAVSRAIMHVMLGIKKENAEDCSCEADHPATYARLLGFRKDKSSILRRISDVGTCKVVTKVADASFATEAMTKMFECDVMAARIYSQVVYRKFGARDGKKLRDEYELGPVIMSQ